MLKIQSLVNSTYKSSDTEEFLDKIFYRPIGYLMAVASKYLGLTPNVITIISIFVGVAAGHFFYYTDLSLNIYGMLLLIIAEALDSADGQLARITDSKSKIGRILDGFGGNLWFISIYIHLCFRYIDGGGTYWIFLLAIVAGISHSAQSAMADYFRNFYVYFAIGKTQSEIDESSLLQKDYKKLAWSKNLFSKFLMRVYINYTIEQELLAGKLKTLYAISKDKFGENLPAWLKQEYKILNKSLIKYFNILTTNTRMIFLFIVLIIGMPVLYWVFEITILNILLIYVIFKQNHNSKYLISAMIENQEDK
ncbi:MAG: CDP-alcohol phosphatidyltransferase family protein [Ignavibacteriae bacterium]|nr:CDP-alcohol phosphatidyltransferase family protein [Ignavibacteriota bacterium]NOG97910.1 CDP-alcohol phosphatidyltransferase family protein [Ignavibacteriota bacterium]